MKVRFVNEFRINEKQFLKWIQSLRSGEYSQTTDRLQDKQGYCCLGVALKTIVPVKKLELDNCGFISRMAHERTRKSEVVAKSFSKWAECTHPYDSAIFPELRLAFDAGLSLGQQEANEKIEELRKCYESWKSHDPVLQSKYNALKKKLEIKKDRIIRAVHEAGFAGDKDNEEELLGYLEAINKEEV